MGKTVIFIQILVLALFLSGCSKREADIDIDGQVEYMLYESVESAQFSVDYDFAYSQDIAQFEIIDKNESENDLKKIYNVIYNSSDTAYGDYECTVNYSGSEMDYMKFYFKIHKKDSDSGEWLEETEKVSIVWYIDSGKLQIRMPFSYEDETGVTYIEKYINTESADILKELFFKYL